MIVAHDRFSAELERQMEDWPRRMRISSSYLHWIRGVYLITLIDPGEQGAFRDYGHDHIAAVNLTQLLEHAEHVERDITTTLAATVERQARWRVRSSLTEASHRVGVVHFVGGPCELGSIACCIVPGGSSGWTVLPSLSAAIELACVRSSSRDADYHGIFVGQTVRLTGLVQRKDLNRERGVVVSYNSSSGRWQVVLESGGGKALRAKNLEPLSAPATTTTTTANTATATSTSEASSNDPLVRVFAFWGCARWSRTQLLGECARGHWGICRASVADVVIDLQHPTSHRADLNDRVAYAPVSMMTEDFMRESERQMTSLEP
eukprot:CAMPEP_0185844842 /NCGR_PEP_ID=MMETSP1354-20130828/939_1 /TAXON_ID=708628 /ORGANISM="Erythrolobus madagascarensis, Strain CCMP3276" /LENGTH=319 /DNA_ID=CAMNT_0028544633 /DNA_START=212 /DNA_END=1171 /DNA_ORIENTATION=-